MFAAKDRRRQDVAGARIPVNPSVRVSSAPRQGSQTPPFPLRRNQLFVKASPPRRSEPLAKAGVFSRLRTLLPALKFQHPYFHALAHSLENERNITPAFPITPGLFVRSYATVQLSSPAFSSACALFCKTTGDRGTAAKNDFSTRRRLHPAVRHDFDVGPIMYSSRLS
jgi:hypothetical protein